MRWIILCLLVCHIGFSQTIETNYRSFSFSKLILDEAVFDEAQLKSLTTDFVIVSFIVNADCKAENFIIKKKGKLQSFNDLIEKSRESLVAEFIEKLQCEAPTVAKSYSIPITAHFQ